jgi:SHAQKYF class myb-like DNA-binding protein
MSQNDLNSAANGPYPSNAISLNSSGMRSDGSGNTDGLLSPVDSKLNGRWGKLEHNRFVEGLKKFGKNWKKVEEHVGTRTGAQIRSHAQKFFNKLQKEVKLGEENDLENKDENGSMTQKTLEQKELVRKLRSTTSKVKRNTLEQQSTNKILSNFDSKYPH